MISKSETPANFKCGYIAIVGKPNAGKSTLLNKLLHFKLAAVTRRAQTTRHQIKGILHGDNHQIILVDTPGMLSPKYKLQQAMVAAAEKAIKSADVTLLIMGPDKKGSLTTELELLQKISEFTKKIIVTLNKVDLVSKDELLPLIRKIHDTKLVEKIIPISALKEDGLDVLVDELANSLPTGVPFYPTDQITDHPERFLATELIREKIFLRFGDEIPYSTTVEIIEFKEQEGRKDLIRAAIYVEKTSQKGILIGKKGAALKDVGKLARIDIEEMLGRPVFLELWVSVKEKWRQNESMLKEFGYYD